MQKEDIKKDALYMHIHTGSVALGEDWLDDITDEDITDEGRLDFFVEVESDGDGWWTEVE